MRADYGKSCPLLSDWRNYLDPDRWGSVLGCEIWDSPGEIARRYSDRGEEWVVLFSGCDFDFGIGSIDNIAEHNYAVFKKMTIT